jgi:hypothetical protein
VPASQSPKFAKLGKAINAITKYLDYRKNRQHPALSYSPILLTAGYNCFCVRPASRSLYCHRYRSIISPSVGHGGSECFYGVEKIKQMTISANSNATISASRARYTILAKCLSNLNLTNIRASTIAITVNATTARCGTVDLPTKKSTPASVACRGWRTVIPD